MLLQWCNTWNQQNAITAHQNYTKFKLANPYLSASEASFSEWDTVQIYLPLSFYLLTYQEPILTCMYLLTVYYVTFWPWTLMTDDYMSVWLSVSRCLLTTSAVTLCQWQDITPSVISRWFSLHALRLAILISSTYLESLTSRYLVSGSSNGSGGS